MADKAPPSSNPLPCCDEAVILDVPLLDEFFGEWVWRGLRRMGQQLFDGGSNNDETFIKLGRPLVQFVILLTTRAQTPATRLLGLQRVPRITKTSSVLSRRDYNFRLIAYALVSALIPVMYAEFKEWHRRKLRQRLANQQNTTTSSSDTAQHLSDQRKFQTVQAIITTVSRAWPLLRLVAILGVWTGLCQTSEIAMILTGWTYQKTTTQPRQLQVDYAQKRWIWEELLRSLRVWGQGLTLLSIWQNDAQRCKDSLCERMGRQQEASEEKNTTNNVPSCCCFCDAKPIIIPLQLYPCGHAACYACLHQRSKTPVTCRLCRRKVVSATKWTVHNGASVNSVKSF